MHIYKALNLIIRHGMILAGLAGLGSLAIGLALVVGVTWAPFWIAVSLVASAAAIYIVLLLREIAQIIADTLVPLP